MLGMSKVADLSCHLLEVATCRELLMHSLCLRSGPWSVHQRCNAASVARRGGLIWTMVYFASFILFVTLWDDGTCSPVSRTGGFVTNCIRQQFSASRDMFLLVGPMNPMAFPLGHHMSMPAHQMSRICTEPLLFRKDRAVRTNYDQSASLLTA